MALWKLTSEFTKSKLYPSVFLLFALFLACSPVFAESLPAPVWQEKTYSYISPIPAEYALATAQEQEFWTEVKLFALGEGAGVGIEKAMKSLGHRAIGKVGGLILGFFLEMPNVGASGKWDVALLGNGGVIDKSGGKVILNQPYVCEGIIDPGDEELIPLQMTIEKKTGLFTWETIETRTILTLDEKTDLVAGGPFNLVSKQLIIFSEAGTYRVNFFSEDGTYWVNSGGEIKVEAVPEALTSVDVYSGNLGPASPGVPSGGAKLVCLEFPYNEVNVQWWYGNATAVDKTYTTHVYFYEKDPLTDDLVTSWHGPVTYPAGNDAALIKSFYPVDISRRTCTDIGNGEFYAKVVVESDDGEVSINSATGYANEDDAGDTCADAVPVQKIPNQDNVLIAGKMDKDADIDYFRYDVTRPGRLTITTRNNQLENAADTTGFLIDSGCTTIKTVNWQGLNDFEISNDVSAGTYYIAAFDQPGSGSGKFYLLDITFTPFDTPTITTGAATGTAQDSATLNATVNPQGATATVYFEYGTTTDYGSRTPDQSIGNPTNDTPVSAAILTLSCGSTYHFRSIVNSSAGEVNGLDQIFTTVACGQGSGSGVVSLPQTGQISCYDSAGTDVPCPDTGQDGDLKMGVSWPFPRFTHPNGSLPVGDIVLDRLSDLEWMQNANLSETSMTWQQALDYVKALNNQNWMGHNDWRLPNIIELESLVNEQQINQADWLNENGFSNVQGGNYWSGSTSHYTEYRSWGFYTTYTPKENNAWSVSFVGGDLTSSNKSNNLYVWPVRSAQSEIISSLKIPKTGQTNCYDASGSVIPCEESGQDGELQKGQAWPDPRFTNLNGSIPTDGDIVLDNLTGLNWTRDANPSGTATNWQQSFNYIDELNGQNYMGYSDWRLPNRKELMSLFNFELAYQGEWLSSQGFFNIQGGYWSSSSKVNNKLDAWLMYMPGYDYRNYFSGNKSEGWYVWPVRGGIKSPEILYSTMFFANSNGTGSCSPATVSSGGSSTCSVTPAANYELSAFTVNGVDKLAEVVNNGYTITTITSDQQVEATFALNTYAITPSATGNGTITCNSTATHGYGASCTIIPGSGYLATTPTGGTCPAGTLNGNIYTTGPVTEPCTVIASFTAGVSQTEALDAAGLTVQSGGSGTWVGQSSVTHDNSSATQSPAISDNQSSYIQVTVAGPGSASFWWKVSSEAGGDYLRFYLDGVEQVGLAPGISGEVDWTEVEGINIPTGNHTLRWVYSKNGAASAGADAGWIDQVLWMPDQDGDGVTDAMDAFPDDPAASLDQDGDGFPETWNPGKTDADSNTGLLMAGADFDQDGLSNAVEGRSGLDPRVDNATLNDTDGDGLPDIYESSVALDTDIANSVTADGDDDGLTDRHEYLFGLDPLASNNDMTDSDGDTVPDSIETALGLDPNAADATLDPDGDGFTNLEEVLLGTLPLVHNSAMRDSDGDGLPDVSEFLAGTSRSTDNRLTDRDNDGQSDLIEYVNGTLALDNSLALIDTDQDTLPDFWELNNGLDPEVANSPTADSDGDGLSDRIEYQLGLSPTTDNSSDPDSDGDGISDRIEALFGLDPASNDAALDSDNDGISNLLEIQNGTPPRIDNAILADSDSDGIPDIVEGIVGTDPQLDNTLLDNDGDGQNDTQEYQVGTLGIPNDQILDDDGDGLSDEYEIANGTDPLNPDISPPGTPVVTGVSYSNSKRPTWLWISGGNGNGTFRYRLGNNDLTAGAITTTSLSFTPASDLADGTYPLYIQERDAAGNWSVSGSFSTIVDTLVPTLSVSTLDNQTTNNATLNVSGTAGDNNQLAILTVNGIATTLTIGSFSYPFTLSSGSNTITIVATDTAGNSTTTTRTVILDQNAPTLTVTTPVDNSATAAAQVTLTGNCGDAANVSVKVNSQTPQSAAITSGSYTLTVNLNEGQNTLTVTATDAVGNNSSVARTITYDATAPTLAITIPDADITTQSMPYAISGSVEDALTDVSLTMTVNGQTVIPTINGAEFTYPLDVVQGGNYQIVVTATDLVGNTATAIRNVIFEPYADLNNDEVTTAADALLALQMAIGMKTVDLSADVAPLVNGVPAPDGKVTAADALVILRKAVGLW